MMHWANQARQWALLGPPLKPSLIDLQNNNLWLQEKIQLQKNNALSVLVLGVTPELIHMTWPVNTTLVAIDCNSLMVKSILPRRAPVVKPLALLGNWLQLPITDASIDLVIGDGCYNSLAYHNYAVLSQEIHRVLKSTGTLIMRFFSKSQANDSIESIHHDIFSKKLDNFHAFKLRLAIALHKDLNQGVYLKHVWKIWNSYFKKDVQAYQHELHWSDALIGSIDTYEKANFFYTFPTLDEIRLVFNHTFTENNIFMPDYQPNNSCPTLHLSPMK